MRGDTRFWRPLIALTFVVVSGLSLTDGRSRASFPATLDTDLFRAIARRQNPVVVAILTTTRRETPSHQDTERFQRVFGWHCRRNFERGVKWDLAFSSAAMARSSPVTMSLQTQMSSESVCWQRRPRPTAPRSSDAIPFRTAP